MGPTLKILHFDKAMARIERAVPTDVSICVQRNGAKARIERINRQGPQQCCSYSLFLMRPRDAYFAQVKFASNRASGGKTNWGVTDHCSKAVTFGDELAIFLDGAGRRHWNARQRWLFAQQACRIFLDLVERLSIFWPRKADIPIGQFALILRYG